MQKIKLTQKKAKIADYTFWAISVIFSFWADWRVGVAFVAFDIMRVFEGMHDGR